MNPHAQATIKAARAAAAQRQKNEPRPRTGRRTQQAIDALLNLRNEISLGRPHKALLERIDDELFKLRKGTKP